MAPQLDPRAVPTAGMLVGADVQLSEPLGSGSMGAVWKAKHLAGQRSVAVKFIAANLRDDPTLRARFEREATAAAQIETPHVVEMLEQGITDGGIPYIVMELLEGETLADLLEREERLSPRRVAVIVTQVAKALSGAHQQQIVHRDIKPENLFITENDEGLLVKVLDFGVAKVVESCGLNLTMKETVLGTPYYISAEQIRSSANVTPLADLWSLAVVCYEALTGKVPFLGSNVAELFLAIQDGACCAPSEHRPELPPEIDRFFERALHADPAVRFASAKELAAAFLAVTSKIPDVFDHDEDYGDWLKTGQFRIPSVPPSSRREGAGRTADQMPRIPRAAKLPAELGGGGPGASLLKSPSGPVHVGHRSSSPAHEEMDDDARSTLAWERRPQPQPERSVDPMAATEHDPRTPSEAEPPTLRQHSYRHLWVVVLLLASVAAGVAGLVTLL